MRMLLSCSTRFHSPLGDVQMSIRRQLHASGDAVSLKSLPPEKPPRGLPRNGPVRIEPLANHENLNSQSNQQSPVLTRCRFSTTEKYTNMKKFFRDLVRQRNGGEFSGSEAVNILDDYLQTNREQFSSNIVKRQNAIKVLDMWLRENVIRPVHWSCKDSPPLFCDSKKVIYIMNPDEDHKLYVCSTPTSYNRSVGRRASRTSSFKRFFSPSRAKSLEGIVNSVSSCRSLSTSSEPESASNRKRPSRTPILYTMEPIRLNANNQSLEEEAELHDAALSRLLTIVEVPMLDDLTSVPGQPTKSASILSSILSKIGLGGGTVELNISKDEEMDDLLEGDLVSGPLVPWFQLARVCAPSLYFKPVGVDQKAELHNFFKASVKAVCDRYSTITHRGSSPLFPTEFSPVIEAIIEQLLGKKKGKTKLALQYLCLMIPQQLRTHLSNIVMFLERTKDTDEFVSIEQPFFNATKGENFENVFDQLRKFIFPSTIEKKDQIRLIEPLLELRKEGNLGRETNELADDLKRLRTSADKVAAPVRFCEDESSAVGFDADTEIAKALRAIIDDVKMSQADKQRKCEIFKEHHPSIYAKFFSHLEWKL